MTPSMTAIKVITKFDRFGASHLTNIQINVFGAVIFWTTAFKKLAIAFTFAVISIQSTVKPRIGPGPISEPRNVLTSRPGSSIRGFTVSAFLCQSLK
jgi:hypothetical protein